jgi:short-subunit dehydrogenase
VTPTERALEPRRVALVTGASRGIGRAIAAALASAGHDLALVARDRARLEVAADAIRAATGRRTATLAFDLGAAGAAERILAACAAQLGPPSVLVNNAGTAPSARFADTDDATLDQVLALHVRAPFALLRAALPGLRAAPPGVAVQVASSAGLRGFPFTAAYTAAKHAMVGLSRALCAEFAREPDLSIYAVCPGFVDTEITRSAAAAVAARGRSSAAEALAAMAAMNRIGRMHAADEVAAAVVRLVLERPAGCVLDLDQDPPAFVP